MATNFNFLRQFSNGEFVAINPEIETILNQCNLSNHRIEIVHQRKRDGQSWKNEGTPSDFKTWSLELYAEQLFQHAYNCYDKADACYIHLDYQEDCSPVENWEGKGFYTSNHIDNELMLSTEINKLYYFNYDVYSHRIAIKII